MKKTSLLLALFFALTAWALAAPLRNIEVKLTQPDGQVIHCYASGDEFYNYLHDANGYTIVKGDGGYYFYAIHDSQGQVVASPYLVNSVDPASVGLKPYVKISEKEYYQRRQAREQYIKQPKRPANRELNHGCYNNLVVFIRFAGDTYHTTPFSEVDSMFNATNYESVSMHNFYHHASYNQLDLYSYFYPEPDGQTILSYEDIYPKEYYMPYDPVTNPIGYQDGETADREFSMLERAIYYIADQVPDTLALDYNDDGKVDNVVFVIKGEPGEWASLLWPHRWCIYDRYVPLNGLQVYDFNLQLEIGGYFTVGTLCHEMCHSLGAPDLYHYSGGIDPVGAWDLMCGTTNPPQHQGVYMKYKYGNWVNDIPDISGQYGTYEIEADSWEGNRRNVYKIALNNYQYLILEYRDNNQVFEKTLPDGGLLIYRIDTRYDGNAGWNGYDQFDEVYLFRPGGSVNQAGYIDQANFCADRDRTEFSIYTDPFLFLTDGQSFDWSERIYNVGKKGDKISFVYGPLNGDGQNPGPENFVAHVNSIEHQVELSWDANENAESYKVYRDGQEIATGITETTFVHPYTSTDNGYHTYSVVSVTGGIMSLLSAPTDQWVVLGNYETLRLSIACDSPFGTKGGEMEISFSNDMPPQYLTIYKGQAAEAEYYVPANTEVTFRWNPGFDPDSEGIHVMAKHLNENSDGTVFDLDRPTSGIIATYTTADEGLGVISPQHLTAISDGTQIQLQWTIPTENHNFNIYRDDRLCSTVNGTYTYLDDRIMRSATHSYQVESVCGAFISWNPENIAYATTMNFYCEPPQNLTGNHENPSHNELSWEAPQFVGHGMMAYDANIFVDQMGSNSNQWGIKIEPAFLTKFEGLPLTHLELFDCSVGTYTFKIYNGELVNNNTIIYTQQHVMTHSMKMVRFALDEEVPFDATIPLWITVQSSGATEPIPCCDYVGEPNSCLVKAGATWRPVTYYNKYFSWLLRAYTREENEARDFTYNVYWGQEEASDHEMVLIQQNLSSLVYTHETPDNSRYNVTAIWNGLETDFSNSVFLGPSVNIEENVNTPDILVFPNPVKSHLTLQGKDVQHVAIYTITGVKVYEQNAFDDRVGIDMGLFPNGMYLLNILSADGSKTVKIIKQ